MAQTPNYKLEEVTPGQSGREYVINLNSRRIDAYLAGVITRGLSAPPGSPTEGAYYIVGASPTGAWSGKANNLAIYINGAWEFIVPPTGAKVWVIDEASDCRFTGSSWVVNGHGDVPPGGLTDEVLTKNSNLDDDYSWKSVTINVLGTALTGFSAAVSATAIIATDTVLQAFGKVQKYLTDYLTNFNGINQLVKLDGTGKLPAIDGSNLVNVAGTGHTIQDEGVSVTNRGILNFTGTGVTVTDNAGSTRTDVTITSSKHTIQDEGVSVTDRGILNFTGTGVTVTDNAGSTRTDVTISAGESLGNPSSNNQFLISQTNGTRSWTSLIYSRIVAVSDETTALTTGNAKMTVPVNINTPFTTLTITNLIATVNTAPTGSTLIVDINKNGVSILSTKLSIDATELTSVTASTSYALTASPTTFVSGDRISIDIDQIGATVAGAGLKVEIQGVLN